MGKVELANIIYEKILGKVAFGGMTKPGVIILEGDLRQISFGIAEVVVKYIRDMSLREVKGFIVDEILG